MRPLPVFCLMLVIILFSCGPSRKSLDAKENALFNQWIGHTKNQLIRQWGVPDSSQPDGRRGEVLIYKERTDMQSVMEEQYTGKLYSVRREMFVNADSVIYTWKAWRRK